jgi:glycosyltransferase involved in cell wall biosynthesis
LYITEFDLSVDNGPGINERECVKVFIEEYEEDVICVAPYPKYPFKYMNPQIEYVFPHQSNPVLYLGFLAAVLLKVLKLHRIHRFKALIFRLGVLPIVPLVLNLILRRPLILKTLDGYAIFGKKNRSWYRRFLSTVSLPIYKAVIKRAEAADTVSLGYLEWLDCHFGADREKLRLIPNGVNIELFLPRDRRSCRAELGLKRFTKVIGYVGAMDSLRQIDDLIHALKSLQDIGHAGLVLVGSGPSQTRLEGLAQSLDLESSVVFTGAIPYAEVPKYMNSFDIGVDLSLVPMQVDGKIIYASYSQKIPQYLSCGLPVIAWDTPDTQFVRDENIGRIVRVKDIHSLVESIKGLLLISDSDSIQMGMRARKYAESYFSTRTLAAERMEFWSGSTQRGK